jgi:DNA-binding NarL/FixJ family response regulator
MTAASASTDVIGVFIVDDHQVVREGLRALLKRDAGMVVLGEAADAESALEQLPELDPDVVVADVRLPGMSGPDLCRAVAEAGLRARIVILSGFLDRHAVSDSFLAGAVAYVVKDVDPHELYGAIRAASRGERRIDPKALPNALERSTGGYLRPPDRDLIRLIRDGRTIPEIAEILHVSHHTVRARLRRIYRDLGCSNRSEAMAVALRRGLI